MTQNEACGTVPFLIVREQNALPSRAYGAGALAWRPAQRGRTTTVKFQGADRLVPCGVTANT